jgi:hypothetical protein
MSHWITRLKPEALSNESSITTKMLITHIANSDASNLQSRGRSTWRGNQAERIAPPISSLLPLDCMAQPAMVTTAKRL